MMRSSGTLRTIRVYRATSARAGRLAPVLAAAPAMPIAMPRLMPHTLMKTVMAAPRSSMAPQPVLRMSCRVWIMESMENPEAAPACGGRLPRGNGAGARRHRRCRQALLLAGGVVGQVDAEPLDAGGLDGAVGDQFAQRLVDLGLQRSEERRVGKEGRSRWAGWS